MGYCHGLSRPPSNCRNLQIKMVAGLTRDIKREAVKRLNI